MCQVGGGRGGGHVKLQVPPIHTVPNKKFCNTYSKVVNTRQNRTIKVNLYILYCTVIFIFSAYVLTTNFLLIASEDNPFLYHLPVYQCCGSASGSYLFIYADPDPYPTTHSFSDLDAQCSKMTLKGFHLLTLMRIRILLFPLIRIRIRIQLPKMMRVHTDPDPQHCSTLLQIHLAVHDSTPTPPPPL